MKNIHKGSKFDDFLKDETLFYQAELVAVKRVIAYELSKEIKKQNITKNKMANSMRTSRSELDRLLDPENTSITLHSLVKASNALGKKLAISFL